MSLLYSLPLVSLLTLLSVDGAPQRRVDNVPLYGGIASFGYYFVDVQVGSASQFQSAIVDTGSPSMAFACDETCGVDDRLRQQTCGTSHMDPYLNLLKSNNSRFLKCPTSLTIAVNMTGNLLHNGTESVYLDPITAASMATNALSAAALSLPVPALPTHRMEEDLGCQQCIGNLCGYELQYGEGSSIAGFWARDEVSLGGVTPMVNATFGCHAKVTDLFLTQKANGIIGLAFSYTRDLFSTIDVFFQDTDNATNKDVFALCLSQKGGELTLGGVPSRILDDQNLTQHFQWTPLFDPDMYVVVATSFRDSNGNTVSLDPEYGGSAILVDSGATTSALHPSAYEILIKSVERNCAKLPDGCVANRLRTSTGRVCYRLPENSFVTDYFEPMAFEMFGGSIFEMPANAYMFPAKTDVWCLSAKPQAHMATLGAGFMNQALLVFDRETEQIGLLRAPLHHANNNPNNNNSNSTNGSNSSTNVFHLCPERDEFYRNAEHASYLAHHRNNTSNRAQEVQEQEEIINGHRDTFDHENVEDTVSNSGHFSQLEDIQSVEVDPSNHHATSNLRRQDTDSTNALSSIVSKINKKRQQRKEDRLLKKEMRKQKLNEKLEALNKKSPKKESIDSDKFDNLRQINEVNEQAQSHVENKNISQRMRLPRIHRENRLFASSFEKLEKDVQETQQIMLEVEEYSQRASTYTTRQSIAQSTGTNNQANVNDWMVYTIPGSNSAAAISTQYMTGSSNNNIYNAGNTFATNSMFVTSSPRTTSGTGTVLTYDTPSTSAYSSSLYSSGTSSSQISTTPSNPFSGGYATTIITSSPFYSTRTNPFLAAANV